MLGSQPEALSGDLQIMVGAPADPRDAPGLGPLLRAMGRPEYFGPVGTAAAVKLALNQLIGTLTVRRALEAGGALCLPVRVCKGAFLVGRGHDHSPILRVQ